MKNFMKLLISAAAVSSIGLVSAPAHAGTAAASMLVSMSVGNQCSIGALPLAFGAYDALGTNATNPLNGTATLIVTCTEGAEAAIALDQGVNDIGGTPFAPQRRASNGGTTMRYDLYQLSGLIQPWGDLGSNAPYFGTGLAQGLTVYGSVPAGQVVPTGNYTDTVVATISF